MGNPLTDGQRRPLRQPRRVYGPQLGQGLWSGARPLRGSVPGRCAFSVVLHPPRLSEGGGALPHSNPQSPPGRGEPQSLVFFWMLLILEKVPLMMNPEQILGHRVLSLALAGSVTLDEPRGHSISVLDCRRG